MANIFKNKYFNFRSFFVFCLLTLAFLFTPSFVKAQVFYISNIDMQGHAIKGMAGPVDPSDATTKAYVDSAVGSAGGLSGSGTTNYISKWTGAGSLGNSLIFDNGTNLGINDATPSYRLDVNGTGNFTGTVVVGAPTLDAHAATKAYVDSAVGSAGGLSGSGTTNYISKWTGSGSLGNSLIFDNGTNVGINDATPSYRLDVNGTGRFTSTVVVGAPTLDTHAATKSYVDSSVIADTNAGTICASGTFLNGDGTCDSITQGLWSLNGTSTYYNTGNVGIGTTSPGTKLDVAGTGNFTGTVVVGAPTLDAHAATKAYVDSAVGSAGGLSGSGTTDYISKWTSSGSLGNSLIFDNGTNVGINDTTPSYKLDVAGTGNFTGTVGVATPTLDGHAATKAYVDSAAGGGLSGSGTTNYISKWTGAGSLGNSLIFDNGTNVGIGSAAPGYKLDVVGTANFTGTVGVATPTAAGHAATKSYIDSILAPYNDGAGFDGYEISGDLNMAGYDIGNVNKLTVNTIDPLYEINNVLYSSYAASVVGGVKEECIGKTTINSYNSSKEEYEKIIDFKKQEEGTELWLWYKTVDFNQDNVDIFMTPIGSMANVYYEVVDDSIVIRSDKKVSVSYRLIGRRFDWKSWPTIAEDQSQTPGLKIE